MQISIPDEKDRPTLGTGACVLDWLRRNPLPSHTRRSEVELDAGIEAEQAAWD